MKWASKYRAPILPAVIELARRGVEKNPNNTLAWQRLIEAQLPAGDTDVITQIVNQAETLHPDATELLYARAKVREAAGDFESAIELYDRYLAFFPEHVGARLRRFSLLESTDHGERADQLAIEIELIDPGNISLVARKAERAWVYGEWSELLRICDSVLKKLPAHTSARYHRALALGMTGRDEEARSTLMADRFTTIRDLPVPDGYSDAVSFRAALREEILCNPTLRDSPRGTATRYGKQTTQLERSESVSVPDLLASIRLAVDEYRTCVTEQHGSGLDGADPFVTGAPSQVRLVSWAVVCGSQGRQTSHIHPDGWLSGVFYVAAPETPRFSHDGALVLGAVSRKSLIDPPWGLRYIEPQPGRLVMFPSWIPHATEATKSDELRICVAFDVVPAES